MKDNLDYPDMLIAPYILQMCFHDCSRLRISFSKVLHNQQGLTVALVNIFTSRKRSTPDMAGCSSIIFLDWQRCTPPFFSSLPRERIATVVQVGARVSPSRCVVELRTLCGEPMRKDTINCWANALALRNMYGDTWQKCCAAAVSFRGQKQRVLFAVCPRPEQRRRGGYHQLQEQK